MSRTIDLGVGVLALREHHADILAGQHDAEWLEIVADSLMGSRRTRFQLDVTPAIEKLAADHPLTLHSLELSIGSVDPFDMDYLAALKELVAILQPRMVSDHLCWTGAFAKHFHELMPLPYEEKVAAYVAERIAFVQDYLGVQMCFENPPNYITYRQSSMSEAEFTAFIAETSDSFLLLDVGNLVVSSTNNHYDPHVFLDTLPADRVRQVHLAGNDRVGDFLLDTHGAAVSAEAWRLYESTLRRFGPVATNIEWDSHVPSFEELDAEVTKAKKIRGSVAAASSRGAARAATDRR